MIDSDQRGEGRVVGGRGKSGYGSAAVVAGGTIAAVLAALLVTGGIGVADAWSASPVTAVAESTQTPSTPGTGAQTPEADPASPPDRGSDQPEADKPKDTVYSVQPGDTLTSISAKLHVGVDAIAEYNAVRDVDVISSGSVLRVPFIYVPPTAANG